MDFWLFTMDQINVVEINIMECINMVVIQNCEINRQPRKVEFLVNGAHQWSIFISVLTITYPFVMLIDIMSLILAVFDKFNPIGCIKTMTCHVCVVF